MTEKELLFEITRIGVGARTLHDATQRIESLLTNEVGAVALLVRPHALNASLFREEIVTRFLESPEYPFRGIYTASVKGGPGRDGCLMACFGSWGAAGDLLERISTHIADSLGTLLRTSRIHWPTHEEAA
jgi:hypothetical protein